MSIDLGYWDQSYPGELTKPTPAPDAYVTPGTPGQWPATGQPADFADLVSLGYLAEDPLHWLPGQYAMLGDGSQVYWNGHEWVPGQAPGSAITNLQAAPPAYVLPYIAMPAELAALKADPEWGDYGWRQNTPEQADSWVLYPYIHLLDDTYASWNGTEWVAHTAPPSVAFADLASLKADAAYGDSGTDTPPGPWHEDWYIPLNDGSFASWSGTEWVVSHPSSDITDVAPGLGGVGGEFIVSGAGPDERVQPPKDLTDLRGHPAIGVIAMKAQNRVAWRGDQWVYLLDHTRAYWTGTGWLLRQWTGVATWVEDGEPGRFTPAGAAFPETLYEMRANPYFGDVAYSGAPAWAPGHWVDAHSDNVYWDGTTWQRGWAP